MDDVDDFSLGNFIKDKETEAVKTRMKKKHFGTVRERRKDTANESKQEEALDSTAAAAQEAKRKYTQVQTKHANAAVSTIAKSNELVSACYKLSLDEQRLVMSALGKIKKGEQARKITITAREFANSFDLDIKNAYTQISVAAHKLYERDIKIKESWEQHGDKQETRMRWLQRITTEKGSGCVELYFNTQIQQYIFQLKNNFTKYKQSHIRNLTSVYAIRIYELLQQHMFRGERTFDVNELRELLGLENRYELWADLKKWVINPALKQINKHTNIDIGSDKNGHMFEVTKRGKKIIALTIYFSEKSQQQLHL